jgi:hypothetical protein
MHLNVRKRYIIDDYITNHYSIVFVLSTIAFLYIQYHSVKEQHLFTRYHFQI